MELVSCCPCSSMLQRNGGRTTKKKRADAHLEKPMMTEVIGNVCWSEANRQTTTSMNVCMLNNKKTMSWNSTLTWRLEQNIVELIVSIHWCVRINNMLKKKNYNKIKHTCTFCNKVLNVSWMLKGGKKSNKNIMICNKAHWLELLRGQSDSVSGPAWRI